jgi:dipeptidase D
MAAFFKITENYNFLFWLIFKSFAYNITRRKQNMYILEGTKPEKVWKFFEEISAIPRGSGNEKGISNFLKNYAEKKGLWVNQDEANNIIIKKPASPGYENSEPVIIQGHMDMVCEKTPESNHDFFKDGIKLIKDGDFITADGTTLGGDDGIAVAMGLALIDDESISHPPIELVLTTDEEVGMNGARNLDFSLLEGRKVLNLDSEEEGYVLAGCAGGLKAEIILPIEKKENDKDCFEITIYGLKGGHSGSDIHLQRASAVKLMGRVLNRIEDLCFLISVDGGKMDNAIPRSCKAVISTDKPQVIERTIEKCEKIFKNEFHISDSGIKIKFEKTKNYEFALDKKTAENAVSLLILIPYGVIDMSLDIKGLVETSNNLGIVETKDDEMIFVSAARSAVGTKKELTSEQFKSLALLTGARLNIKGRYPAWEFRQDSPLRDTLLSVYREMFKKEAKVTTIHAGLECGIFSDNLMGADMVSIGPQMYGIHTTEEKISISSVERTWNFVLEVLKRLK